jgi:hypothetical protein
MNEEEKNASVRYLSLEKVTVTGFYNFCRNNIPLIITVSITLFFTYGIKLFWHSIGIDTELFMADKSGSLKWSISIGRFGYALLSKLWYIKEFNPYTAFFTTFCLIWFSTISWCYIIAIFSMDTVKNNKLIPFALVFMTMPVWTEQFYFLLQAAENALIISLCPYVIYLLFKGFIDHEKIKIICAFILLAFMTSVYQAIVPMFCCGVFICFVLLQEHSEYEQRVYRSLCLKLFITLLGSLAVYFFIDRIIIPYVFHIARSEYIDDMNQWGKRPVRENINIIFSFRYILTMVMHIPSVWILSSTIFFLLKITLVMCRTIPSGRRLLYILAGIGIPLSIVLIHVIGGNQPPIRSLYSLPLAFAFMLFYSTEHIIIKPFKLIITCLSLLIAVYQAQITAQLFYSDQLRYNEDVRLAYELNNLITKVQPGNEKLPVVLVGKYQTASRNQVNFIQGDVIGHSVFGWGLTNKRGLSFMGSLGINIDMPDENQIEQGYKEAESMSSYPHPDCVKRMQDFIVIRIAETMY